MAVGCRPFAEDSLADAHDIGAFLDRFLEVPRHAHREFGERGVALHGLVAQAAQQAEAGTDLVHVGAEQRQGHQAPWLETRELIERVDEGQERIRRQAVLALFVRCVDLDIDVEEAILLLQTLVEEIGETQAVECMELAGKARQVFHLVGLQVADDAPVDRQVGQRLPLALCFLDLVFAKRLDAGGKGEAQDMRRYRLRDR